MSALLRRVPTHCVAARLVTAAPLSFSAAACTTPARAMFTCTRVVCARITSTEPSPASPTTGAAAPLNVEKQVAAAAAAAAATASSTSAEASPAGATAAHNAASNAGSALDVAMRVNGLKRAHQQSSGSKKALEGDAWLALNSLTEEQINTAEGKAVALLLNSWAYFAKFWEKGKDGP